MATDKQIAANRIPELAGNGDIEITRVQNRNFVLGEGFHRATQKPHTWALFLRYQAQAERQYRRATQEFDRLRALRPDFEKEEIEEIPNEPISPTQPESTQPDPAPETNPIGGLTPPSARAPQVAPPDATTPPAPQTLPMPPSRFDPDAFRSIMGRPTLASDLQIVYP